MIGQPQKKRFLLPFLLTTLVFTGFADDQGWLNNSLTLKTSSTISIKFTQEIRHHELTLADAYLSNWSGGFAWTLANGVYLGASFHRETTLKTTANLYENRTLFDAGWKTALSEKTALDLRLRTEIRSFEDDLAKDHLRLRLRARLATTLKWGAITTRPFLAVEPFFNAAEGEFNCNRIYAGVTIPLNRQIDWTVNYIRQDTSGKDTLHVFNTGFDLKIQP